MWHFSTEKNYCFTNSFGPLYEFVIGEVIFKEPLYCLLWGKTVMFSMLGLQYMYKVSIFRWYKLGQVKREREFHNMFRSFRFVSTSIPSIGRHLWEELNIFILSFFHLPTFLKFLKEIPQKQISVEVLWIWNPRRIKMNPMGAVTYSDSEIRTYRVYQELWQA